ncbi:MAG: anthranilate synthase component I [Deltaproteobacteria bacterium]|nr:anthranilate synthase component I [Deltaproteobacteria bacterium]MBW2413053.1 anthranilate synthase component I [Deltaproteobacteria bacterium]
MVRPDRDGFRALARGASAVPLVREVLADLDTPLASFLKLDDGETAFLFESLEGGEEWGRYSIIGCGARASFLAKDGRVEITRRGAVETLELPPDHSVDPLEHFRPLLEEFRPVDVPGLPRLTGGAVGYLSHDWVRYVERLPDANPDPLGVPDCFFRFPEVVLVHDSRRQRISIVTFVEASEQADPDAAWEAAVARIDDVERKLAEPVRRPGSLAPSAPQGEPLEMRSSLTREQYHEIVKRAQEYIQAGDIFQVVPSQRLELPLRSEPIEIYRWMRAINPSPYLFFLRGPGHVVVGASPEILVRLEGRDITLRPIAGTCPRGADDAEDQANERELLADPKELAEHVMLVDLGRNDVGRVAEIGTVHVDEFKVIERYSHVMHIVSNVRGRLRESSDAIDLLRACFPAGTLTGAPKVRAMEIIDELEPVRRGIYGGCVGYIDDRGDLDMCIAIRTLLIQDGKIYVQAGGGVVADSDPELEYQESLQKARAALRAIERAEGGPE